jgi:plastocyanin
MKLIMRITIFAFALSLIACTLAVTAGQRPKRTIHTVIIEGMEFRPEALTVAVGDIVVWVNKDLVAHTATSSKAGVFDSKLIAPDKSWKLTVRARGDFDYVCTYHPTMKATLRVE